MQKTDPNDNVHPINEQSWNQGEQVWNTYPCLTKIEHFASIASDDFSQFNIGLQILIVGEDPPNFEFNNEVKIVYNTEYAQWLTKGRAKWKLMHAIALIEELNRED